MKGLFATLAGVQMGENLPDWSHLTIGNRFAVALRFVPSPLRAAVLNRSRNQIARYEGANADDPQAPKIPDEVLAAVAREANVAPEWIRSGQPVARSLGSAFAEQTLSYGTDGAPDVPLQKLAFRPSAGRGTLVMDETAESVRFPRAILEHIRIKPEHARLMESSGESMRPTIEDRDTMVVDVSSTDIVEGKVYVFTVGDEVFVKRLRRGPGGRVYMMSDNRDLFPNDEPVPDEAALTIHARVRWTGRSL